MTTRRILMEQMWALEFIAHRNAVARWRGEPSCSDHELVHALHALCSHSHFAAVTELAKDPPSSLRPLEVFGRRPFDETVFIGGDEWVTSKLTAPASLAQTWH